MHLNKFRISMIALFVSLIASTAMACTPQTPVDPNPTTTTSSTTSTTPIPTTWDFSLRVGVTSDLVTKYGGLTAIRTKIDQQLVEVNARYAGFTKPIRWTVGELYTYSQPAWVEVNSSFASNHAGQDFLLLYAEGTGGAGWYGSQHSIVIDWAPASSGIFDTNAMYALVHELGHARGMIDMYQLQVSSNPISGGLYAPPAGFMTYPYGATDFDAYNQAIGNAAGPDVNYDVIVPDNLPTSYKVVVKNLSGTTVSGASVSLYPMSWGAGSISTSALQTGSTSTNGIWTTPSNPFVPSVGQPWDLTYPLLLIKATSAGKTGYGWVSLPDAGLAYFANPTAAFSVTVTVA